jgi:hypothetical protein
MRLSFVRSGVPLLVGLFLVSCGTENPNGRPDLTQHGYAEGVYDTYQSGAQGLITFHVETVETGSLTALANRPISDLVPVPAQWIEKTQKGGFIAGVRLEARDGAFDFWTEPVDLKKFEELGHPLAQGSYRLLAVDVVMNPAAGAVEEHHAALELSWPSQDYSIVLDPVVQQLDGFARSHTKALLAGLAAPVVTEAPRRDTGIEPDASRHCTLNSHPTWYGEYIHWNAYDDPYTNLYGIQVLDLRLGAQQVEVDCYVASGACKASPAGYSDASSCSANFLFSCACKNTGLQYGYGNGDATLKTAAETQCAGSNVVSGGASVSWSKGGAGASFNINWSHSGSVDDHNGGELLDTCSYHTF